MPSTQTHTHRHTHDTHRKTQIHTWHRHIQQHTDTHTCKETHTHKTRHTEPHTHSSLPSSFRQLVWTQALFLFHSWIPSEVSGTQYLLNKCLLTWTEPQESQPRQLLRAAMRKMSAVWISCWLNPAYKVLTGRFYIVKTLLRPSCLPFPQIPDAILSPSDGACSLLAVAS